MGMTQLRTKVMTKHSFYEELENAFNQFPKYHMKILLDFIEKVGRENIFKPTKGMRVYMK
jgi:hypothetical protein